MLVCVCVCVCIFWFFVMHIKDYIYIYIYIYPRACLLYLHTSLISWQQNTDLIHRVLLFSLIK